jgi:pimeloyl-ACP methyl ester carboxylesterase
MQHFSSVGVDIAFLDFQPTGEDRDQIIMLVHGFGSTHAVNWVNTLWVKALTHAGYRVVAHDNRGHGESEKLRDPAAYDSALMADDVVRLMDYLGIAAAHVMGYSMGARISAHVALQAPERVKGLALGGLGIHLVEGMGLPLGIADAMEAPSLASLTDPMQRMFRAFADANKADLAALAACIRGSRQTLSAQDVGRIMAPTLVSVGTNDPIVGAPQPLAALLPHGEAFDIQGRDHNLAVGDRSHKEAVLAFLARVEAGSVTSA